MPKEGIAKEQGGGVWQYIDGIGVVQPRGVDLVKQAKCGLCLQWNEVKLSNLRSSIQPQYRGKSNAALRQANRDRIAFRERLAADERIRARDVISSLDEDISRLTAESEIVEGKLGEIEIALRGSADEIQRLRAIWREIRTLRSDWGDVVSVTTFSKLFEDVESRGYEKQAEAETLESRKLELREMSQALFREIRDKKLQRSTIA